MGEQGEEVPRKTLEQCVQRSGGQAFSVGPENRVTAIGVCVYVPSTQWEIDEAPVNSWGSCQSNIAQNCIV